MLRTRRLLAALPALWTGTAVLALLLPPAGSAQPITRPTWHELSPMQREALAPLAGQWDTMEADRKRKWLEVAAKYPQLSPEGKQRLHERMADFARLTPQQRQTARENFRRAYELPPDQRAAALEQYKGMDREQRRALADQAARKAEPPRRPARDSKDERRAPSATGRP